MNPELSSIPDPCFKRIAEASPTAIVVFRLSDSIFIEANESFLRLLGYSRDEVVGSTCREVPIWSSEEDEADIVARIKAHGKLRNLVDQLRGKNGRTRTAMLSAEKLDLNGETHLVGYFTDISELHTTQERLAQSQALTKTGSWHVLFGPDEASDVWSYSQEHHRIFGTTEWCELGSCCAIPLMTPEEEKRVFELWHAAKRGEAPSEWDYRILVDGKERWIHVTTQFKRDENGKPIEASGTNQDITDRKRIEEQLRLQSLVLDQIQDHVTITDLDGVVRYENQAQRRAYGSRARLAIGSRIDFSEGSPDTDSSREEIVAATRSNGFWRGRVTNRLAGKDPVIVDLKTVLVRDDQGHPVAMVGVGTDVTARSRIEDALRSSEERYRTAFQTSLDCIAITRFSDDVFVDANQTFLDTLGYDREEVLFHRALDINLWSNPRDRIRFTEEIKRTGTCRNLEARFRKKNGQQIWMLVSASVMHFDNEPCFLCVARDISEGKLSEERIKYLAHFDTLTGLPNRTQLEDRAAFTLGLAHRNQTSVALLLFDLDHFKDINDTLGHSIGDALLIEIANRLRGSLRAEDTVSRLGGDGFVFLLYGIYASGATVVAQKLLDNIAKPCRIGGYDLNITGSVGIAMYPNDGSDLETLMRCADAAMFRAKRHGRNSYRFFKKEMEEKTALHLQLINALRFAQERSELALHYQPQIDAQTGRLVGAEALLRWTNPLLGTVEPSVFIPAAEESGLILSIGEWVIRKAVRQLAIWNKQGMAPLVVAVNLSAVQFRQPDFPQMVTRILDEEGLPANCLELELTEGVAMHDPLAATAVLNDLYERGIGIAIDDFGTGYSSLSHLKKFRVHKLKIDRSFVRDICTDPEDKAIVSAVINMAKSLGLKTVAEGVETGRQERFLRDQGCDEIQGYYHSKPLPPEAFEAYCQSLTSGAIMS